VKLSQKLNSKPVAVREEEKDPKSGKRLLNGCQAPNLRQADGCLPGRNIDLLIDCSTWGYCTGLTTASLAWDLVACQSVTAPKSKFGTVPQGNLKLCCL